jgi:predicted  nucleic acid-binding Zn-ribbon protein
MLPPLGPQMRWAVIISISVLGLILFAMWAMGWLGSPGFAREDNTVKLEERVKDVEQAIKTADLKRERDALTAWVSELGRDIFNLERDIQDLEKHGRAVPALFIQHLNKMKADYEGAKRRLNKLEEDHPEIATQPRSFTTIRLIAGD